MSSSIYIEDLFLDLVLLIDIGKISAVRQDIPTLYSFQTTLISGQSLTQSQGNLILKLMHRYSPVALSHGLDYNEALKTPVWKQEFRIIDLTRKIWIELDETGTPTVCAKFPYQLKKEFDDQFGNNTYSAWDPERKIRKISLYRINLIQLQEFAKKHNFDVDDTFEVAIGEIEEIWQRQSEVIPYSYFTEDGIQLGNASADTIEWWNNQPPMSLDTKMLLAKSMGYPLKPIELAKHEPIVKIASTASCVFWQKNLIDFLDLISTIDGKVCMILDRAGKSIDWLKEFDLILTRSKYNRDDVKVCFRAGKHEDPGLNDWIKDHGFGGKVDEGKLLIFNHKPAKWLFKTPEDVKIIATNNLYQPTNITARDWFSSHPCVIYVGDIKPSIHKETKIVEL